MMAKDVLSVFACLSISLSFSLNISFGSIRLDTIDELVRANTTICGISLIIHGNRLSWGLR